MENLHFLRYTDTHLRLLYNKDFVPRPQFSQKICFEKKKQKMCRKVDFKIVLIGFKSYIKRIKIIFPNTLL